MRLDIVGERPRARPRDGFTVLEDMRFASPSKGEFAAAECACAGSGPATRRKTITLLTNDLERGLRPTRRPLQGPMQI